MNAEKRDIPKRIHKEKGNHQSQNQKDDKEDAQDQDQDKDIIVRNAIEEVAAEVIIIAHRYLDQKIEKGKI